MTVRSSFIGRAQTGCWSSKNTARTISTEESVLQEVERNVSTTVRVVSREPIFHNSLPGALSLTKDCIPFICDVSRHFLRDTRVIFKAVIARQRFRRNFAAIVLFTGFSLKGVINVHDKCCITGQMCYNTYASLATKIYF